MPEWWNNQGATVTVHKGDRIPAVRRLNGTTGATARDCSSDVEALQDITMSVQKPAASPGARLGETLMLMVQAGTWFSCCCNSAQHTARSVLTFELLRAALRGYAVARCATYGPQPTHASLP